MKVTFMQPLMVECDKSGYITGVRVLQLVVEASAVSFFRYSTPFIPKTQEDVPVNILWSFFNELRIVNCLEKHIRTISTTTEGNRYLSVRNVLCEYIDYAHNNGIFGARFLPVKRADGVICHEDMFAVIAKYKHPTRSVRNAAGYLFFDYKGNMYNEQQLCTAFDWARDEIAHLYRDEVTTHFSNESGQTVLSYRPATYDRLDYVAPLKTRDDVVAALISQPDITLSSNWDGSVQFSQVVNQERQLCYIYENCRTAKIQVEPPVKLWQLQGHDVVEDLEITGSCAPIFKNVNKLYNLELDVKHSYTPMKLPLVAMAPGNCVTSTALISISQPYMEEYVDYSSRICDCKLLRVFLGTQQSNRVKLPDTSWLGYYATLSTPSFMLVVDKMRREYSTPSMDADEMMDYNGIVQCCEIGLALGKVQNAYFDLQQAHHSMFDIMFRPVETRGSTTALVKLPKQTFCLRLGTSARGISENLYGGVIDSLTYYNDIWRDDQNYGVGALHVYAHVKRLQIYTQGELIQKPIYMHGGVDEVEIIPIHADYSRYARCASSIHVPKKSKVRVYRKEYSGEIASLPVVVPFVASEPSVYKTTALTEVQITKYSLKDEAAVKSFITADL